jgi:hypothetical protein
MSFAHFTEVEFKASYPVVHAQEGMCHAPGYCSCGAYQRDLIRLGGKILRIVQEFDGVRDLGPQHQVKEELALQWTCHSDDLDGCSYMYFGCGQRVPETRLDSQSFSRVPWCRIFRCSMPSKG